MKIKEKNKMESLTAWSTFAIAVLTLGIVILAGVNFQKFIENVRLMSNSVKAQSRSIELQNESLKTQSKSIDLQVQAIHAQTKAIELTKRLNQPICAIKDLKVVRARSDVVKISAIITNMGNYTARNALIYWEMGLIEHLKQVNPVYAKLMESKGKTKVTILPKHEFERWLLYINTVDFDKMIDGYEKAVVVRLVIEYLNMENKKEQYSCVYYVTRMLSINDPYDVTLQESRVDTL
jgi:hypothetical protein